jgi:chromosome segregation ATPase
MQRQTRLIVVSSLFAAVASVNPIEKTISLLKELQVKIGKDDDHEKAAYRKYKDFCDDATSEKIHEIEVLSAQKKRLTAEVQQLAANAEAATATIEETAQTLQKNAGQLSTAKSVRQDEASAFQAAEKELVTSIDMLGRAIDIVERESQKKHSGAAALTQMTIGKGGLDGAVSALSAVVEAAGLNVRDMSQLSALLQSGQDEGDDSAEETLGAPKEAAYESKSRGVLDLMGDLREKAETQLREAREAETEARHSYEMSRQALSDEAAAVDKEMKNARAAKSSSEQTKAEKEGDLTGTTRELDESKNTLEETQQSCMRHAADHEASLQGRAGELDALAKALNVISATTGAAAGRTYSFVQVTSASHGKRIVDIVRRLAKKHKSRQLLQLASRVAAAVQLGSGKNAASPFTKVKGLISEMVARLEKEATEEADEKAYCDSEMQKSSARQNELKDQTTKLQTKIDQAVAASAKAMSQRKGIESELVGLLKVQEEMDQGRVDEHQAYVEAKADMQEGLDGVRAAIRQLREYYTGSANADGEAFLQEGTEDSLAQQMLQPSPPTGHSKSTGAGSSIIGLLEVIDADLAKALAELETEESGALAEYEQTTQANKVTKATMDKDVAYKTRKYSALEKSISDLGSDFSTADEELTAVGEYLGELEKRCIAKPEKYEDRKAKREAEIRGLQEALASIRGESSTSSFLQRKRRSLRGH